MLFLALLKEENAKLFKYCRGLLRLPDTWHVCENTGVCGSPFTLTSLMLDSFWRLQIETFSCFSLCAFGPAGVYRGHALAHPRCCRCRCCSTWLQNRFDRCHPWLPPHLVRRGDLIRFQFHGPLQSVKAVKFHQSGSRGSVAALWLCGSWASVRRRYGHNLNTFQYVFKDRDRANAKMWWTLSKLLPSYCPDHSQLVVVYDLLSLLSAVSAHVCSAQRAVKTRIWIPHACTPATF